MKTLQERLDAIVALLPVKEQARFTAPQTAQESADSRLAEAVRTLAKSEGLVCMTPGEFARSVAQHAVQRSIPAIENDDSPASLVARLAKFTDPRAQTAFWRSLTAAQRAAILNVK